MRVEHVTGYVVMVMLALPGIAGAQQQGVRLEEAIKLALRAQPAVIQAQGDVYSASARRREAIGNWLPTLSASSSWSKNSSTRFDQATQRNITAASPSSYSAGLNTSLELFDGFRRISQNRAAGANLDAAEASLVNQRFQATLQTKQAFYDALYYVELQRVQETRVQSAQEQLKIAKEKLAAGSAIRSDTLRATVAVGNAQLQLLNAGAQRATAEATLARYIGADGSVQAIADSADLAVIPLDTAAVRAEALDNSPAIAQAEAQLKAAGAQVNVSRAGYVPSVSASYNRSWSGTSLDALNPSWTMRLSLSWTLFNGFTRETGLSAALASRDAADARAADARRQANVQVTQQIANLAAAQANHGIANASRGAAEEALRVQRERYRLGAATIVEVLDAQASLDQASVDAVNARRAYQIAHANLEALVGREL